MMENHELSMSKRTTVISQKRSSSSALGHGVNFGRQNLASAIEHHGSGRKSLSKSLLVDSNPGNVSFRKDHIDDDMAPKLATTMEDERSSPS